MEYHELIECIAGIGIPCMCVCVSWHWSSCFSCTNPLKENGRIMRVHPPNDARVWLMFWSAKVLGSNFSSPLPACISGGDGGRATEGRLSIYEQVLLSSWLVFPSACLAGEKKKGGALKCDALSGSGSSVPRSHLRAFDDARRVRVGEVSGAKNTSRG